MTAPQKANKPGDLDIAKLMEMAEPIHVRVVKTRGNSQQPIPLPLNEGYDVEGMGFDRAGVQKVEGVVKDLAGGGHYLGAATDANGVTIKWTFGWPTSQYPEKIPPGDAFAALGGRPPGVPAAVAGPPPTATSSWPPVGYAGGFAQPPAAAAPLQPWGLPGLPAYPAPQAGGYAPYGAPAPQPFGAWSPYMQPPTPGVDPARAELERQLQREREQRIEERHARELEAVKRTGDTKIDQLAAVVAQLADAVKRPQGESDTEKTLRAELQAERDRRERAEEKAEARAREEAAERRHQESLAAVRAEVAAVAAAVNAAPRGPDPLLEVMRESARAQTENVREMARMNEAGINKLATQMMDPMRLAEVISKAGKGAEESFQGLTQRMFGILDMQRSAAESALQMNAQPGEHPAITVIKDTVQAAKETATRYMKSQEAEKTAEAQLAAVRAQAEAQTRMAAINGQAHVAATQAAHANGAPLNGATPPAQVVAPTETVAAESPANPPIVVVDATAEAAAAVAAAAQPMPASPEKAAPFTAAERKMFEQDVVFDAVARLRLGVRSGLSDQLTTEAILKGIAGVRTMNIVVPAFMLYEEGHQEAFVDLLLPDAPQALKDAVVMSLTAVRNSEMQRAAADEKSDAEDANGEESEQEDEEGEDQEDGEQEAVAS